MHMVDELWYKTLVIYLSDVCWCGKVGLVHIRSLFYLGRDHPLCLPVNNKADDENISELTDEWLGYW